VRYDKYYPKAARVLKDMVAQNHRPPSYLVEELLNEAIFLGESEFLTTVAQICLQLDFVVLGYGEISKLLYSASARGGGELARLSIELLGKHGYEITLKDFCCWVRACVKDRNMEMAIEALMAAQNCGFDVLTEQSHGNSLQELLAYSLDSIRKLDELYYALLDLSSKKLTIPSILLNSIIMGAGRISQVDRAFATFHEFESHFGTKPDLHSYNALLHAAAKSRYPTVRSVLAVIQEMDGRGFKPNQTTFSILIEVTK